MAPKIRLRDPLADFLGASVDGLLDYGYADVVKLAGHSCPTVASAYLMARAALGALFPGALAERGAVRVDMPHEAGMTIPPFGGPPSTRFSTVPQRRQE